MTADADVGDTGDEGPRDHPPAVVGIGASAGGLVALRTLLGALPERPGLAIVVIVHLAPEHQSHLADLLQPHVKMPVRQVTETVPLESDHVYVIPPGRNLSAVDTHLRLSELEDRRNRSPIDHFFGTLADAHDGHAIGIILTGTGTDGTIGLGAIQARGGVTIVQDPEEAEYEGMPRSALAAGHVDLALHVDEIAEHIVRLGTEPPPLAADEGAEVTDAQRKQLRQIFAQVRARTGHDLDGYKESTVLRRISRRMQLGQCADLDAYLDMLRRDRDEVERLHNDLLISVTGFFRDPEVYRAMDHDAVPALFEGRDAREVVRVWSVGCSSGEEVYSLAMLLLEHAAAHDDPPRVQLFASDLHERSLQRARVAVYPTSIESDVSPERLRRFFTQENGSYRVRQEVRDMVVFAPHDLLKDPPFSHLDLVVCRNLLIYLQREVQQRVIALFHYALDPGGFLVLGTSESLDRSDLFTVVDKQHCIFRRRDVAVREHPLPLFAAAPRTGIPDEPEAVETRRDVGYDAVHAAMIERHGPPSMLVDAQHRIVHYSARAGRFLQHPGGEPSNDVFRLIRQELRVELRTALHAVRSEDVAVVGQPVIVRGDGGETTVTVRAFPSPGDDADLVLVILDEHPAGGDGDAEVPNVPDGVIAQLEAELDLTRSRLQTVIEEYETGQEEMKAANEELQSTNEELRSTLEELETSKEELQSMNEELATLNQENRHKVEELALLSSDLQNLLTATDIATLFLDRQLRIVRFTPPVSDLFNVVHDDRGRPLSDFTHRLRYERLGADAQRVLDRLVPIEHEIESTDQRVLLTRILPYRTADDRIEGVVITFIDITRRVEAESAMSSSERRLRLALDATALGSWAVEDDDGGTGDDRALEIIGAAPSDERGFVELLEACVVEDRRDELRAVLETDSRAVVELPARRLDDRRDIHLAIHARRVDDGRGASEITTIGTIADVTGRVETTQMLAERGARQALVAEAAARLLRGTDPRSVVDTLFAEMSELFEFELYERFEYVDEEFRLTAGNHQVADVVAQHGIGADVNREAADRGEALTFDDVSTSSDPRLDVMRAEHIASYATFPLIAGGAVLGALSFATRRARRLDDEALAQVRTIVDCLAVAEQRLRAEAELRALNESLESAVDRRTRHLHQRERQFRALVEASSEAVWLADEDGRIAHSAPSWDIDSEAELKWPSTGWIGAVHPAHRERAERAWSTALAERSTFEIDARIGHAATDTWRWTTIRGVPLVDPTDEWSWVGMILDIDERVRADKQVRRLAGNLTRAEHQERERLAEVLHDDLQQLLYGAQMRVELLREQLEDASLERLSDQTDSAAQYLEEGIDLTRRLSLDLAPPSLGSSDLGDTIRWLAEQMGEMHDLDVSVTLPDRLLIESKDVRVLIYQALRELLFNVVKHAETNQVKVVVGVGDDRINLHVEDGGRGFDPDDLLDESRPGHRGLTTIRQRIELIGGSFELKSIPGDGTIVHLATPTPEIDH